MRYLITIISALLLTLAFAQPPGRGPDKVEVVAPDGVFSAYYATQLTEDFEGVNRTLVECFQRGAVVLRHYGHVDPVTGISWHLLGPTAFWKGGDAECVATAGYWRFPQARWVGLSSAEFVAFDTTE